MDWLLERTVHRGMVGTLIGKAIFTDLDFADDVALEILSVLVLALGLTINWAKIKIQTTDVTVPPGTIQSKLVEAMWRLSILLHILVPNFTAQVEASMKLIDAFPSPTTVCRCWTGTFGGP